MAAIASAALALYEDLPKACSLGDAEFTVVAAIVAEKIDTGEVKVLSLATGTKCCGEAVHATVRKHGTIVGDSHAEILARRSFHLHVLESVSALLFQEDGRAQRRHEGSVDPSSEEAVGFAEENILELVNGKARLRKGLTLNLYISDNPCGDASIYSRCGVGGGEDEGYTGAKRAKKSESGEVDSEERQGQELGVLRTKSGRSDIPDKFRTASMSCSDKICRWLCLGLQGSILSPFVDSLPICRVVVGLDPLATEGNQLMALQRALVSRINQTDIAITEVELVVVDPSGPTFSKGKCKAQEESLLRSATANSGAENEATRKRKRDIKPRPSGSSVNWVREVKGSAYSDIVEKKDPSKAKEKEKARRVKGGTLEITQAQSGSLLGISKAMIGTLKGSSRLCSRKRALRVASLFRQSHNLIDHSIRAKLASNTYKVAGNSGKIEGEGDGKEEKALIARAVSMPYQWWKEADQGYAERRDKFLAQTPFKDWLVNQEPLNFIVGSQEL